LIVPVLMPDRNALSSGQICADAELHNAARIVTKIAIGPSLMNA
jgi:hypothetical protein